MLSAYDSGADPEIVAGFLLEFVEAYGDEQGYDDIIDTLEVARLMAVWRRP